MSGKLALVAPDGHVVLSNEYTIVPHEPFELIPSEDFTHADFVRAEAEARKHSSPPRKPFQTGKP